jgi:hypothetical protein
VGQGREMLKEILRSVGWVVKPLFRKKVEGPDAVTHTYNLSSGLLRRRRSGGLWFQARLGRKFERPHLNL